VATPGSRRTAGQLPALYAIVTRHVTTALYSCPRELYVAQSTKCFGVQRQPLGESMVLPIPGCDDLLLPLLEVVWPGKHHIWGPPTTTSQHPAPATLHPYGWVHTLWQVIRYNSYELCEAARVLLLIRETDTVEVLVLRYGAEAIEHLFQSGRDASEMPCLVLLNPNMPRLESFRIL
jgi:hypothetical protein